MPHYIHMITHPLYHAVLDVLKLLPLLFLTYLLMEFLEHNMSSKTDAAIARAGKAGPLLGSLLGLLPQCGFSGAASNLYAARVISLGTLFSVFLATSDEMLPIMIAEKASASVIFTILAFKLTCSVIAGFAIDLIFRSKRVIDIDALCERENCSCGKGGIFLSALLHTVKISIFILVVTFALELVMDNGGEQWLSGSALSAPFLGEMISAAIGLIPNCASSVIITNLFLSGAISFGAMLSGLLCNCGVGLLILFRVNKSMKENVKITVLLYAIGVVLGFSGGLLYNLIF